MEGELIMLDEDWKDALNANISSDKDKKQEEDNEESVMAAMIAACI